MKISGALVVTLELHWLRSGRIAHYQRWPRVVWLILFLFDFVNIHRLFTIHENCKQILLCSLWNQRLCALDNLLRCKCMCWQCICLVLSCSALFLNWMRCEAMLVRKPSATMITCGGIFEETVDLIKFLLQLVDCFLHFSLTYLVVSLNIHQCAHRNRQ